MDLYVFVDCLFRTIRLHLMLFDPQHGHFFSLKAENSHGVFGGKLFHVSWSFNHRFFQHRYHTSWEKNWKLLTIPNPIRILQYKQFNREVARETWNRALTGLGALFG